MCDFRLDTRRWRGDSSTAGLVFRRDLLESETTWGGVLRVRLNWTVEIPCSYSQWASKPILSCLQSFSFQNPFLAGRTPNAPNNKIHGLIFEAQAKCCLHPPRLGLPWTILPRPVPPVFGSHFYCFVSVVNEFSHRIS